MELVDGPERLTLREFANRRDRDRSPIFAGRENELAWLTRRVESMRADWKRHGDVSAPIHTVVGCPGIGKTALAREFERRLEGEYLVVPADLSAMRSIEHLEARARASAGAKWFADAMSLIPDGVFANAASLAKEWETESRIARKGVVVLADEAQMLGKRHADVLNAMHTGFGKQPIFPVFFGLSNTHAALEGAGLSRIDPANRMALDLLPERESAAVVARFEDMLDVRVPASIRERLIGESSGFPQHLFSGLRAVAGEILRAQTRGRDIEPRRIFEKARSFREAYYEDRVGTGVGDHVDIAAEIADRTARRPMKRARVVEAVKKALVGRAPEWALGPHIADEARDLFDEMVKRGVLSPRDDQTYATPIPSFLTWLRDNHLPEHAAAHGNGSQAGRDALAPATRPDRSHRCRD